MEDTFFAFSQGMREFVGLIRNNVVGHSGAFFHEPILSPLTHLESEKAGTAPDG